MPNFPDGFPSIQDFKYLEVKGRIFIFRQIARHSEQFIKATSIPRSGKTPGKKLLETWLQQTQPPPTWSTLLDILKKIGMSKVAKKIEDFFHSLALHFSREADEAAAREEAAKEGFVRIRSRNIVITGAGGAGKTCTMSVMFGEKPPKKYTSTGVCESSKSAACVSLVRNVENANRVMFTDGKYTWLAGDKLIRLIAHGANACLQSNQKSADQSNGHAVPSQAVVKPSIEHSEDKALPTKSSSSKNDSEAGIPSKSPLQVNRSLEGDTKPLNPNTASAIVPVSDSGVVNPTRMVPLAQKILADVAKLMKDRSNPSGPLQVDILHIVDSGGQLQFHEMIKKFLTDLHAIIFTTDITKPIESRVFDLFVVDGNPVGEPYESQYTHEQLFKRSLQAFQLQNQSAKLAVVATHIDLVEEEKRPSKIADKNEWICAITESGKIDEKNVIYSGDAASDVVFALKADDPSEADKEVAQRLLAHLCDDVPVEALEIPLRRFLLEQTMREAGKESRGVVSMTECKEIAQSFGITSVKEVLHYLCNRNLILYVPEVINDLVFCEVQTPLNVVKQLVQYSAKVRADSELKCVPRANLNPANLKALATLGTLTEKLLLSVEFKSQFDEKFTPKKFLKLLEHLNIIAEKNPLEYFMPCILREIPQDDLKQHRMADSKFVEPLLLYFSEWPLASVFCSLIARLVSIYGWTPMLFRKKKCLYRNCIKLNENESQFSVTLIESYDSGFFEVHLTLPSGKSPASYQTLCPMVRGMLFEALPSELQVQDAFICPIEDCKDSKPHAAVLKNGMLKCTVVHGDAMMLKATDKRYIWFGECF